MTVKEAKKLVRHFDQLKRGKVIKTKTCICCRNNEIDLGHFGESKHYPDPVKQEQGAWNDGTVGVFYGGFGSIHDMDGFVFGICDKCITSLKEDNIIEDIKEIEREYRSDELEKLVEREIKIKDLLDGSTGL
jgi:hypothetical protein